MTSRIFLDEILLEVSMKKIIFLVGIFSLPLFAQETEYFDYDDSQFYEESNDSGSSDETVIDRGRGGGRRGPGRDRDRGPRGPRKGPPRRDPRGPSGPRDRDQYVYLRCGSYDGRYQTCYVNGWVLNASLVDKDGASPCQQNIDWGVGQNYIWVNNGCTGGFGVWTGR